MTMNFHLVNITLIKQIHDNYMVIRVLKYNKSIIRLFFNTNYHK